MTDSVDMSFNSHSTRDRIPKNHPLRVIKDTVNRDLKELSRDYCKIPVPAGELLIPPGKLIRALLLQVLYSIPTERLLLEQLDYNLLFRWFVGLSVDEDIWDYAPFSRNLKRLSKTHIVEKFFTLIREQIEAQGLLSDKHFAVDWTLIDAWASDFRDHSEKRDRE